jgi:magnesium-transporting ATPase (P-type)
MTGHAILTPLLMVIVMITGDFLSMSLTTDNVSPSPMPNAWRIGSLTMASVVMGVCLLAFCTAVLAVGKFGMNLGTEALRTLAFVVLVFGSQATLCAIRHRRHLWGIRPSLWLAVSSVADIAIASTLAVGGIAMMPLPALVRGWHACGSGCLRIHLGFHKGTDLRSSQGCLERIRVDHPRPAISCSESQMRHSYSLQVEPARSAERSLTMLRRITSRIAA